MLLEQQLACNDWTSVRVTLWMTCCCSVNLSKHYETFDHCLTMQLPFSSLVKSKAVVDTKGMDHMIRCSRAESQSDHNRADHHLPCPTKLAKLKIPLSQMSPQDWFHGGMDGTENFESIARTNSAARSHHRAHHRNVDDQNSNKSFALLLLLGIGSLLYLVLTRWIRGRLKSIKPFQRYPSPCFEVVRSHW